jgi:UrcA family protein
MTLSHLPIRTALLALSAVALTPASAATTTTSEPVGQAANPPESSDIVVEAPRALPGPKSNRANRANRFAGEAQVFATVRVPVMYYDLDLTQPDGARRLMERIHNTARQACSYLDALYPLRPDPECVRNAETKAGPAARAAIEAKKAGKPAPGPGPISPP